MNPFQHASSTTVFCAAAVIFVPVLITLCFAARDVTAELLSRLADGADVIVVTLRVPVDVVCNDGVTTERAEVRALVVLRAPRADVAVVCADVAVVCDGVRGEVRGVAASAPKLPIKNTENKTRIFFNGILPIISMIFYHKIGRSPRGFLIKNGRMTRPYKSMLPMIIFRWHDVLPQRFFSHQLPF